MKELGKSYNLKSNLLYEFCSAVLDTGYWGSPVEYLREFQHCELSEISEEGLIKITEDLKTKKGMFCENIEQDNTIVSVPTTFDQFIGGATD